MATFHIANDGHFFVRQGYSILGEDDEDRVSTYQVAPRGERIFEFLQWKGGEKIDLLLFCALRVEGALWNSRYRDPCPPLALVPLVKKQIDIALHQPAVRPLRHLALTFMLRSDFFLDRVVEHVSSHFPHRQEAVHVGAIIYLAGRTEEARRRLRS